MDQSLRNLEQRFLADPEDFEAVGAYQRIKIRLGEDLPTEKDDIIKFSKIKAYDKERRLLLCKSYLLSMLANNIGRPSIVAYQIQSDFHSVNKGDQWPVDYVKEIVNADQSRYAPWVAYRLLIQKLCHPQWAKSILESRNNYGFELVASLKYYLLDQYFNWASKLIEEKRVVRPAYSAFLLARESGFQAATLWAKNFIQSVALTDPEASFAAYKLYSYCPITCTGRWIEDMVVLHKDFDTCNELIKSGDWSPTLMRRLTNV